ERGPERRDGGLALPRRLDGLAALVARQDVVGGRPGFVGLDGWPAAQGLEDLLSAPALDAQLPGLAAAAGPNAEPGHQPVAVETGLGQALDVGVGEPASSGYPRHGCLTKFARFARHTWLRTGWKWSAMTRRSTGIVIKRAKE